MSKVENNNNNNNNNMTEQQQKAVAAAAADDAVEEDVCCPKFDPEWFHEKELTWKEKPFVKESVSCIFYVPLTYGRAMTRAHAKMKEADAMPPEQKDYVCLDDMGSPFGSTIYLSSTKPEVPGAKMATLSGTFLTKVYDGPYSNCGKWVKDMQCHVMEKKGKAPSKIYAYYATCPKCAKKYGMSHTVLFAKIDE